MTLTNLSCLKFGLIFITIEITTVSEKTSVNTTLLCLNIFLPTDQQLLSKSLRKLRQMIKATKMQVRNLLN